MRVQLVFYPRELRLDPLYHFSPNHVASQSTILKEEAGYFMMTSDYFGCISEYCGCEVPTPYLLAKITQHQTVITVRSQDSSHTPLNHLEEAH